MRFLGIEPLTLWITLLFGLLLAGVAFCLGFMLLGIDAGRAALIGAGLGLAQSIGSLYYIWKRFVRPGPPPRGGGQPG
ncbi:MAG TPA: hypothetical protein PK280_20405 [Planctomycetota bacterium]|nr:hypothetical protein [Planctomycetota bacterium]